MGLDPGFYDSILLDPNVGFDVTVNGRGIRACVSLKPGELELGGEVAPLSIVGKMGCKASDCPGVKRGDVVLFDGVSYSVLRTHVDETGWATLFLGRSFA